MAINVVEKCIDYFGSASAFARAMEVERQVVHAWSKRGYIPSRYAYEVERLTDGKVTAVQVIKQADANLRRPARVVRVGEGDRVIRARTA